MFDRTSESPQIPNSPKNEAKDLPSSSPKNNKTFLFIGIGSGIVVLIVVLALFVFNSPKNNIENSASNPFVDIKGKYTGGGKVLNINITSLTTQDSITYSFEYNFSTTQKPLDVGTGTYIPSSNSINFNKEIIGNVLLDKKDNTIFIKNDFWTVKKEN
ncbi:MAG: hypothetical protein COZ18_11440 [Flexibacter sp. CG_4_10_14_3_um_filter_32_15]|nr:MAG: hypothetical protein COZ18_11440 [Flexibacter sp. CG_4_10_14_3_um_filter_32_15]